MSRMKMIGITAAALLCLTLARADRAAAGDSSVNPGQSAAANNAVHQGQSAAANNAVNRGQSQGAGASVAAPNAYQSQGTANAAPGAALGRCLLCCTELPLGGAHLCCSDLIFPFCVVV